MTPSLVGCTIGRLPKPGTLEGDLSYRDLCRYSQSALLTFMVPLSKPLEGSFASKNGIRPWLCKGRREYGVRNLSHFFYWQVTIDELVKSRKLTFFVIPAKAGIQ